MHLPPPRTLTLNEVGSPISSSSDSALPVGFNNADSNPIYPYSQRVHPENNLFFSSIEGTGNASISASSATTGLFDPHRPRYPSSKFLPHLAGLFFDHLACHFPFLDRKEVIQAVEGETLPAVLANCIAALACRFSENPELLKSGRRAVAGEAFADMAKVCLHLSLLIETMTDVVLVKRIAAFGCTYALVAVGRSCPNSGSACMG